MTGREKLLAAVNTLEGAHVQAARLGGANFAQHRREVVQLRRVILAQNSEIDSLGDEAFENSETRAAFRREFAEMRSAMAFHQASWPVVSINVDNPDYVASLNSVRDASRKFISWVMNALKVA